MTNTLTVSSSYGLGYYYSTGQTMYLHELNRSGKTNQICYYNSSIYSSSYCSNGTWGKATAKIGLMYASDYQLSLGSRALNYTGISNYNTLKTGWMHISNNDSGTPEPHEWAISRPGADGNGIYYAWGVNSSGYIYFGKVYNSYAVRPVFYLEPQVEYLSGTGTIDDPIMIVE